MSVLYDTWRVSLCLLNFFQAYSPESYHFGFFSFHSLWGPFDMKVGAPKTIVFLLRVVSYLAGSSSLRGGVMGRRWMDH